MRRVYVFIAFMFLGGASALTQAGSVGNLRPDKNQTGSSQQSKQPTPAKKLKGAKRPTSAKPGGIEEAVRLQKAKNVRPTMTLAPGTVGSYFYPQYPGSYWRLRAVTAWTDVDGRMLSSDTVIHMEKVLKNDRMSLQRLPLIDCEATAYLPGSEKALLKEQTTYYVDDSVIMAVFNNSISNGENRVLLMNPLSEGSFWPERPGIDTIGSIVASLSDTVTVPAGTFTNTLVTVTRMGQSEMIKYFAPGHGIVKTFFHAPGPSGRGRRVVSTELLEVFDAGIEPMGSEESLTPPEAPRK